ncbi:MAG: nicotinate-nucleotide--dimethylbenzimidazole phosphoribosyltransferase [Desulfovibrionaceae bacterium]|jgi:nicotinate-nucleotide--dimethylbenzimidazole phosphoribosyltransferase|nr:nicotinate-nucleotide--dimethylbenzimidazole phosphoribosyltransferase [Desulfovibrionaceae bacterium]
MQQRLGDALAAIQPTDPARKAALDAAGQAHLDDLTKPRGSLGRLEELALQAHRVQGGARPLAADPARIYTIAADHGAADPDAEPRVSLFPQEVTRQMVLNFTAGGAGINVLARTAGAQLKVVDAGCRGGTFPEHPDLIQRKVAPGTANLVNGPAMTRAQCEEALLLGLDLADMAHADGCRVVGTGDMGIGNTTASTALYCAYLGLDPLEMTGPGAGLPSEGVRRKAAAIATALKNNAAAVASGDPVEVLAALGGLEIAALAGLALGAARRRMLLLVDGFISTAGFVAAWKIHPAVADYAIMSHASAEAGHVRALEAMGLAPLLHLSMRLGEGTGAAMALQVLRAAVNVFNDMATFSQAGVSAA